MAMVSGFHSSSSRATAQTCFSYDVFLSFRGEDTRKSFTDHLYTALKQAGIRTFRDDDEMERGKMLKPELDKAIHESAISLIVFSNGYASSKWCLDEVMMIMKEHETSSSKHEVVPVFYKVQPTDVRNQRESFKKAFDVYDDEIKAETDIEKKTELLEKVGAWRDSLRKAANFTGMEYSDGFEAKFVNDIVNVIRKKLDYKALYIKDRLVGIQENVEEIELWLQDPSPDAAILLIDGMGGIGKTTIATCIYNSNSGNYDGCCFLANINETSNQPGGLLRLQSQLLSTILKSGKEETVWNVHEGTKKVTDAISNKKVFLILDDVGTIEQLDALLGPKRFLPGSKVIITTTHRELSTAFTVQPKVQSVRTLSTDDAIELFSLYAFHQHHPIEPYIVQSQLFVNHCKGLPLALQVLGSSLRGKTIDEWEDAMHKLAATPHTGIQKVLQISYETLEDGTEKDLFLHIACFFEGEEKDFIVKLLAECDLYPVVGIKNLIDRCLVYVEDGRVKMHQSIKEMGREVVRKESEKEPGKRSRLWRHQDCIDVLQDQSGTKKVEGLMIDMQKKEEAKSTSAIMINNNPRLAENLGKRVYGNDADFKIGALEKMKNLMLLQLNYATLSGKCKKLPRKLRLLRWHGCTLKSIPSDICLEKLVVLDMSHSKLKHVWDDFKVIESLKILNLSHSVELTKTPDFGGLPGLESLILKGCSSLIKVDKSIVSLPKLVLLDLTDCTNLRESPCLPTSLLSLQMSGCGVLGRIQILESVPSFSLLEKLNLSYCNLFDNSFPNDWSSLVSLVKLDIDGNNVTSLPKCTQTLPCIQELTVRGCSQLKSVLGPPESLRYLYGGENESLEKVQITRNQVYAEFKYNCPKLCEMEGRFKIRSIDKVERKIIRYLGLDSDAGEVVELGLKVLHEFGIFSTCVPEKQIPSRFMYRETGPQISFEVPWHDDSLRIIGFNMCVVLSQPNRPDIFGLDIEVYNKTKDMAWIYRKGHEEFPENVEKFAWLSVWRCGNILDGGDEIVISIIEHADITYEDDEDEDEVVQDYPRRVRLVLHHQKVEECHINLLYEDEDGERVDGEKEEAHGVGAFDRISWTDRMDTDILSDFDYSGGTYFFNNCYWPNQMIRPRVQLCTAPELSWGDNLVFDREGHLVMSSTYGTKRLKLDVANWLARDGIYKTRDTTRRLIL